MAFMVCARQPNFQFATHANYLSMIVSDDASWWSTIDWNRSLSYFTGSYRECGECLTLGIIFDAVSQWQPPQWQYMIWVSKIFYQWLEWIIDVYGVLQHWLLPKRYVDALPDQPSSHWECIYGLIWSGWALPDCPQNKTIGLRQLILGRGSVGLSLLFYISLYNVAYIIPSVSPANLKYS
jgi:hypothetical protein